MFVLGHFGSQEIEFVESLQVEVLSFAFEDMVVVASEGITMVVGLVREIVHITWNMGVAEACFHKCFLSSPIAKVG